MNIVLDSNILFSALIKDSTTRQLILEYDGFFLFPAFIFEELEKHKALIIQKSGMEPEDFDKLFQLLLKKVVIVPNEVLGSYREKAKEIVKEIDIDDVLFIACALEYPGSILWSDDKRLKKQSKVKVLNTPEIKEVLK